LWYDRVMTDYMIECVYLFVADMECARIVLIHSFMTDRGCARIVYVCWNE